MTKDPYSIFIDDSVLAVTNDYYNLMFKTKRIFFDYLLKGKSKEDFAKKIESIWGNVDRTFMNERIKDLEKMVEQKDLKGHDILNPDAEFKEIFELISESKFKEVENKYARDIEKFYDRNLAVVDKDYVDKESYLTEIVEKFNKVENTVPYYYKNGKKIIYHNVASYNSMLYNNNLRYSAWNRTMYDAKLLNNDLLYLPAHTFACPLCQPWQGKIYSESGRSLIYPAKEEAINGGVGHPNCKHCWTIYWDESQLQNNTYDSEEWVEKYEDKQKLNSLNLTIEKIENDKSIYNKLNNQDKVDTLNKRLNKLKEKKEELQKRIK